MIFVIFIILVILIIVIKGNKYPNLIKQKNYTTPPRVYFPKPLMTDFEKYFFDILNNEFKNEYIIIPQMNLAAIINKKKEFQNQFQNELFRNIDFALVNKETLLTELLIELNDKTHNQRNRIARDIKVKSICENAKINLITFYSNMPNKKDYIINRVLKELEKDTI